MTRPDPSCYAARSTLRVRAYRSGFAWLVLLAVLLAGLTTDLASKAWTFRDVDMTDSSRSGWSPPPHGAIEILPAGLLNMRLVVNHGAVFGIGAHQRYFFIVFTVAAMAIGLFVFGRMTRCDHRIAHIAIGMILAGGIGNLYDRWVFGFVRDFLHALPDLRLPFGWRWPGGSPELFPWVFNVADMLLLFGMVLLLIHMHRLEKQRKVSSAESAVIQIG